MSSDIATGIQERPAGTNTATAAGRWDFLSKIFRKNPEQPAPARAEQPQDVFRRRIEQVASRDAGVSQEAARIAGVALMPYWGANTPAMEGLLLGLAGNPTFVDQATSQDPVKRDSVREVYAILAEAKTFFDSTDGGATRLQRTHIIPMSYSGRAGSVETTIDADRRGESYQAVSSMAARNLLSEPTVDVLHRLEAAHIDDPKSNYRNGDRRLTVLGQGGGGLVLSVHDDGVTALVLTTNSAVKLNANGSFEDKEYAAGRPILSLPKPAASVRRGYQTYRP